MSSIPTMSFHLLREGDRNEFVTEVKKQLAKFKLLSEDQLSIGRDGESEFDEATLHAVIKFQREAGLGVDGVVGQHTWYRLMLPLKTGMVQFFNKSIYYNNHYKGVSIFTGKLELLFPFKIDLIRFLKIFSDVQRLTGKEQLSLNEFVAHFSIMYNETGGLNQLTEIGGPAYMFGTNGGRKYSYNRPLLGNIPAGDALKAKGVISSDADVATWNGDIYPHSAPQEVKNEALNCDFYKYRGRGLHQLTFRDNYINYAKPVLDQHNLDMLNMTNAELDAAFQRPEIYTEVFKNFITKQPGSQQIIENLKNNAAFEAYGELVAGRTGLGIRYAKQIFIPRCQNLKDAILLHLKPKDVNYFSLID